MNIIDILMISIGLSFDVFAVTTVEGAMLAKVEKKKLGIMCVIFCLWQLVAVLLGNLITLIPLFQDSASGLQFLWNIISAVIFFAMASFMIYKGWRKEDIFERREEINFKNVCVTALIVSLDAFFAGIGFGFLNAELLIVGVAIELVTILFVILGVYTGYRLGYEQKTKALLIGGVILLIASIDIVFRFISN